MLIFGSIYACVRHRYRIALERVHPDSHTPKHTRTYTYPECLNTRDPTIILKVLHILELLVEADTASGDGKSRGLIGQALVPYYRQLLPILNIFCQDNKKKESDAIEYDQRRKTDLEQAIIDTLALLEFHGGHDAFINIKYLIPTYQSTLAPS